MHLKLHIGTAKTGTTTIQTFLQTNRKKIYDQGILFPSTTDYFKGNHLFFTLIGYLPDQTCEFTIRENLNTSIEKEKKLLLKIAELKKEINSFNGHTCIISSEQLSSNLKYSSQIEKIKKFVDTLFDSVEIIIYIRRPIEHSISNVATRARNGDIKPFLEPKSNKEIIENWINIFGIQNITLKLFDKREFYQNDLIKDFCNLTKIKINKEFIFPENQNESLDYRLIKYLIFLNKNIPKFIEKKVNPERTRIFEILLESYKTSNIFYLPSENEFKYFENKFQFDNEWIRQKFFPNRKYLWPNYVKGFREEENQLENITYDESYFFPLLTNILKRIKDSQERNKRLRKQLNESIENNQKLRNQLNESIENNQKLRNQLNESI